MAEYIRIFDTTLRDGEQTPGVSLVPDEKLEIAIQLDKLGVDVIEAGFPSASEGEFQAVKRIAEAGLKVEICALARAMKSDVDIAMRCEVDSIHTFISSSDIQIKYVLNSTREEVLRETEEIIQYIKDHGFVCEFSPMDATRTDLDFLKKICLVAQECKVDRINIPDTVGVASPCFMRSLISELKKVIKVPISVHCHNDFGMAVANSLAGVEGGATQVHVTVNGLGERAGNAALEEVVMALHVIYKKKTGINTKLLYETSKLVSRITGIPIQPNKAIVGENAFAHESGIHTKGVVTKPETFEPLKPEMVGRKRKMVAGKHAGRQGLKAELEAVGIYVTDDQLNEIFKRVKALGDKGKPVTDTDLFAIARAVTGIPEKNVVKLLGFTVVTGSETTPMASVKLTIHDKEYVATETGVGPVDSAIKAIQRIVDKLVGVRLKEYRLEAITGGSDAIAEVMIKVEDDQGNIVSASSAGEDIVNASVEAMINGINKLLMKRELLKQSNPQAN
ncbi:MAG: 2-isopropylmalate synthase [Candidatus Bathyarchaeia archaeon]